MNEKNALHRYCQIKTGALFRGYRHRRRKYTGIIGALRGVILTALVTNRETAELLLK